MGVAVLLFIGQNYVFTWVTEWLSEWDRLLSLNWPSSFSEWKTIFKISSGTGDSPSTIWENIGSDSINGTCGKHPPKPCAQTFKSNLVDEWDSVDKVNVLTYVFLCKGCKNNTAFCLSEYLDMHSACAF